MTTPDNRYFSNNYFPGAYFPPPATGTSSAVSVAAGFFGLLDFMGLAVGQGTSVPPQGEPQGFVDFFALGGLFVGQGTAVAPPVSIPQGHGVKIGGVLYLQAYLIWLEDRKRMTKRRERVLSVKSAMSKSVLGEFEQKSIAEKQKRMAEFQMFSVLLAEI